MRAMWLHYPDDAQARANGTQFLWGRDLLVPVDPVRQHTGEVVSGPTIVRIYRGANGTFTLYEDDGISQEYLERKSSWTRMIWDDSRRHLTIEPGAPRGADNLVRPRSFEARLIPDGVSKEVKYAGRPVIVEF